VTLRSPLDGLICAQVEQRSEYVNLKPWAESGRPVARKGRVAWAHAGVRRTCRVCLLLTLSIAQSATYTRRATPPSQTNLLSAHQDWNALDQFGMHMT
jgi:hypothetical protein